MELGLGPPCFSPVMTVDPLLDGFQRGLAAEDLVQIGKTPFHCSTRRGCVEVLAEKLENGLQSHDEAIEPAVLNAKRKQGVCGEIRNVGVRRMVDQKVVKASLTNDVAMRTLRSATWAAIRLNEATQRFTTRISTPRGFHGSGCRDLALAC